MKEGHRSASESSNRGLARFGRGEECMTLEDNLRHHRLMIMQRAAALGNVTRVCQEAGISRTLYYRWRHRLLRYGPDGLLPRATRPARWPCQATPALEHAVGVLRSEPGAISWQR